MTVAVWLWYICMLFDFTHVLGGPTLGWAYFRVKGGPTFESRVGLLSSQGWAYFRVKGGPTFKSRVGLFSGEGSSIIRPSPSLSSH